MRAVPKNIHRILSISTDSIGAGPACLSERIRLMADPHVGDLQAILEWRNGFHAFESALHFFPASAIAPDISIDDWNARELWVDVYEGLADDRLFFAEDVFGGQFCIFDGSIHSFDPETGGMNHLAGSMDEWAGLILSDHEFLTGYPLGHAWQLAHGPIPVGKRLLPKIPFVAGGSYSIENLHAVDSVAGMRFRGEIACRIKDLPDGESIGFDVVD